MNEIEKLKELLKASNIETSKSNEIWNAICDVRIKDMEIAMSKGSDSYFYSKMGKIEKSKL